MKCLQFFEEANTKVQTGFAVAAAKLSNSNACQALLAQQKHSRMQHETYANVLRFAAGWSKFLSGCMSYFSLYPQISWFPSSLFTCFCASQLLIATCCIRSRCSEGVTCILNYVVLQESPAVQRDKKLSMLLLFLRRWKNLELIFDIKNIKLPQTAVFVEHVLFGWFGDSCVVTMRKSTMSLVVNPYVF